jgi:putative ABC transport system permease protein
VLRLLRQVSLPQLRASWGRTALVVGGIATGVALIVAIAVINTSVLANFRHTIELIAGPAALEVTLGVGEVGFDESAVETVRADPGVEIAVPLVRGTVALADDPGETLQLFGADLTTDADLERYRVTLTTDRGDILTWLNDPDSIALARTFAARHGLDLGSALKLSTPQGVRDFTVRGLLEPEGLARAYGGQLALMDLPAAQLLLAKDGRVDQVDLMLAPDADVDAVRRRLQAALPPTLTVERPEQRGEQYERILATFQTMLNGLSLLCLVAGIYIIYNTTSTGAVHRALAMARLRVVGADAATLFRLMLAEAAVLGTIGTLAGIGVGLGMAAVLSGMVTDSMGIIFQLRFPVERLAIDPPALAGIALVGVGAALFASLFAARYVARLEPLDVLRSTVRSMPRLRSRPLVLWWLVLVGVSVAALVGQERWGSVALGNFGATLWNASVIVIAIPLVGWLGGTLSRVLPRLFGAEGRMAVESLLLSPARTGVTTAAIALVLTVGIMLSSLTLSFRRSMNDYVGRVLAADLIVSAVTTEGGWLETPVPGRLATEIAAVPGVQEVGGFRVLPGQIYRGLRITVAGMTDGFFDPARYPSYWYHEGDAARAAALIRAGEGVNISTGLSDRTGLHVGDTIELDTPTGRLALPIVGIVPDYMSDRGTVLLSRRLLAERWREPTLSRINLTLAPGASADQVRAEIVRRLGADYRLKILSTRDVLAYHDRMINRAFAFTDAIQLLVIIVTVAGIFDLLVSAIIERRRELALWQVIGADAGAVRRSVVIESSTIGALGALLGVAVGLITAWIWIRFNFRYLLGYYLERHFAFGAAAWYVALVMVMTVLAGYAAAYQATRQSVVEGIQQE